MILEFTDPENNAPCALIVTDVKAVLPVVAAWRKANGPHEKARSYITTYEAQTVYAAAEESSVLIQRWRRALDEHALAQKG